MDCAGASGLKLFCGGQMRHGAPDGGAVADGGNEARLRIRPGGYQRADNLRVSQRRRHNQNRRSFRVLSVRGQVFVVQQAQDLRGAGIGFFNSSSSACLAEPMQVTLSCHPMVCSGRQESPCASNISTIFNIRLFFCSSVSFPADLGITARGWL